MRILFVNKQFGPGSVQGTERYLSTLGACLSERGHEVSYLAGAAGVRSLGEQVALAPATFAYPSRGWMSVVGVSPRRVEAWLAERRPDVIHLANPAFVGVGAMRAARQLAIPLVVTIMDFWWLCPKTTLLRSDGHICDGSPGWSACIGCLVADHARAYVRWLGRWPRALSPVTLGLYYARAAARGMAPADMARWLRRREVLLAHLKMADAVIFPSQAACDAIRPSLAHDRGQVIPYGLSAEWFANPQPPRADTQDKRPLTLGYAGAILPHKAPHLLPLAVRRLGWDDCRIRIAGPARDQGYLDLVRQASEGLNVECVGSLSSDRMPAFLRSLDALAMTSLWPENLPFVVLEAQAAGVPVVASNVPGVADQIGDRRLLFEPGSVDALASALAYLREHPDPGQPARVSTVEAMTDATEAVYQTAMSRP